MNKSMENGLLVVNLVMPATEEYFRDYGFASNLEMLAVLQRLAEESNQKFCYSLPRSEWIVERLLSVKTLRVKPVLVFLVHETDCWKEYNPCFKESDGAEVDIYADGVSPRRLMVPRKNWIRVSVDEKILPTTVTARISKEICGIQDAEIYVVAFHRPGPKWFIGALAQARAGQSAAPLLAAVQLQLGKWKNPDGSFQIPALAILCQGFLAAHPDPKESEVTDIRNALTAMGWLALAQGAKRETDKCVDPNCSSAECGREDQQMAWWRGVFPDGLQLEQVEREWDGEHGIALPKEVRKLVEYVNGHGAVECINPILARQSAKVVVFGLSESSPIVKALMKVSTCLRLPTNTAVIVDDGTPETFLRGGSEALVHQKKNQPCALVIMRIPSSGTRVSGLEDGKCVSAREILGALVSSSAKRIDTTELETLLLRLYRETSLASSGKGV